MEKYKYSIKKQIFSRFDDKTTLRREIIQKVGCSRGTFYRWWNIKADDEECIPSDALKKIAAVLGTTMDELYTKQEECHV